MPIGWLSLCFFGEMSISAHFLIESFVLLLSCMSFLCILEIKPLSVESFANVFLPVLGCVFVYGFLCCVKAYKFE